MFSCSSTFGLRTIGAYMCRGFVQFPFLIGTPRDSNQVRPNLNKKSWRINNVGHHVPLAPLFLFSLLNVYSPYSTGNWLPNANEIDTKNMKCTCRTQEILFGTQCNLYSTDLHWGFALGEFGVGGNAIFRF